MKTQKPFCFDNWSGCVHCRKPNLNQTLNNVLSFGNSFPLIRLNIILFACYCKSCCMWMYIKRMAHFWITKWKKFSFFIFTEENLSLSLWRQAIITMAVTQTTTEIECFYDDQFNFTLFFFNVVVGIIKALFAFQPITHSRDCYAVLKIINTIYFLWKVALYFSFEIALKSRIII